MEIIDNKCVYLITSSLFSELSKSTILDLLLVQAALDLFGIPPFCGDEDFFTEKRKKYAFYYF